MKRVVGVAVVAIAFAVPVRANGQEQPPEEPGSDIMSLPQLEEDLRSRVVAGTSRREQTIQTAPGVAEVITAEDIRAAGYRSVGEALAPVAGLVVYNDLVFYNVGVRGVFGGERAGSRIIKVLVDGQPVALRTSSANFLGPEMIPIELVERIEIVRGPGSVLFGANAFLGVVNVVTRNASNILGVDPLAGQQKSSAMTLTAGGLLGSSSPSASGTTATLPQPGPGGFASVVLGALGGDVEVTGGVGISHADRSGLALPTSSPRYAEMATDPYSRDDIADTAAAYGRLVYHSPVLGAVRMTGRYSLFHGHGEFQDRNTLSHRNHIALENASFTLDSERKLTDWLVLRSFGVYSQGGPTAHQYMGEEGSPTALRLETGFRAVDVGFDLFAILGDWATVLGGADFSWDEERRPSVREVYLEPVGTIEAGSVVALDNVKGAVPFRTIGAFGLLTMTPFSSSPSSFFKDLGLTAGARFERNSVYGASLDWRGGVVLPLGTQFYSKLLGGSSFKGPAAEELYTVPLAPGDLSGNPSLRPQRATTFELVAGWIPSGNFHVSVVGYLNFVRDQIRYQNSIAGQIPQNVTRQDTQGVEVVARLTQPIDHTWKVDGFVNFSLLNTVAEIPGPTGVPSRQAPDLFPPITGNASVTVRHRPTHLGLNIEGRLMGPRPSSRDNAQHWLRRPTYDLPAAFVLDAALTTDFFRLAPDIQVRGAIRASNVLGISYALPGFSGFDIPGTQRTLIAEASFSY